MKLLTDDDDDPLVIYDLMTQRQIARKELDTNLS